MSINIPIYLRVCDYLLKQGQLYVGNIALPTTESGYFVSFKKPATENMSCVLGTPLK